MVIPWSVSSQTTNNISVCETQTDRKMHRVGTRYHLLGGKLGVLCGKINNNLTK